MSTPAEVAAAVQAVADAVGAATVDPGDGIRLLLQLAVSPAPRAVPPGDRSLAAAMAARCRRAALVAACGQSAQWRPTSSDDAQAMIVLMGAALDAEITVAGDAGDDASFGALLALRAAVISDLSARGASLAPLMSVALPGVTNALNLAAKTYNDAAREAELTRRINPVHPLFIGGTVQILAR